MEVSTRVTTPSRIQVARQSWARFGEFLPDIRRRWRVVLIASTTALATIAVLALGRVVAHTLPYGAVAAQGVFVLWAAGWFYLGFWRHRAMYRQRYANSAYRHLCLRFLLPALIGGGAALWYPILVSGDKLVPPMLAYGLAVYLLLTTRLMELRGIEIFWSWDVRAFVYSVFPERGPVFTSGIFGWLRHPVYSAGMRWVFALALLRDNAPALLCAALVSGGFGLMAQLEERELAERDAGYAAYRRHVPGFFVLRALPFWRFLLTGKPAARSDA